MTLEELRELFRDLLSKDYKPMLCDTEVPMYGTSVPCGEPTMSYDDIVESVLLPKEILSMHPEFLMPVRGDSMTGAGIEAGDVVKIVCEVTPKDGDIVLAYIDDGYTLKTYCEDDKGRKWLLPQNDNYQPILLNDKTNVRIYGRVKEVVKQAPRMTYKECMKVINRADQLMNEKQKLSPEKVDWVIKEIADEVKQGRQWYAVYRPLVEKEVVDEGDYIAFCNLVNKAVPQHEHLPVADELQRMAVQSFRKPVRLWKPKDAPVQGKRFTDYQQIGLETLELLEHEM